MINDDNNDFDLNQLREQFQLLNANYTKVRKELEENYQQELYIFERKYRKKIKALINQVNDNREKEKNYKKCLNQYELKINYLIIVVILLLCFVFFSIFN